MYQPEIELEYTPEAEQRVEDELNSVSRDELGFVIVTQQQIAAMDPRTRLCLLLGALAGRRIQDKKVFAACKEEFWGILNTFTGGITKAGWSKYAHRCKPVQDAAQHHRDQFVSRQPKREA